LVGFQTIYPNIGVPQVPISDLSSVDINWKMLTNVRPGNKMEEEFLWKLVELDRLSLASRELERIELAHNGGKDSDIVILRPSQSMAMVTQNIVKVGVRVLQG
jgi:hypothetical protein